MAFHIVTNRCFLACEKVTSVVIEEVASSIMLEKSSSKKKTLEKKAKTSKKPKATSQFFITISYYPLATQQSAGNGFGGSNSRSDQENTLEIRVKTEKEANLLFREIIQEVQEQHPNEGYLDQLVDKLLAGTKFSEVEPDDDVVDR